MRIKTKVRLARFNESAEDRPDRRSFALDTGEVTDTVGDLSSIIGELERMYGEALRHWFSDPAEWTIEARTALEQPPIVSVASRGRKRTVGGWYTPAVWFDSTDDLLAALAGTGASVAEPVKRAEIVVASEVLGDPVQTIAELCRQMAQHAVGSLRVGENYYYPQSWEGIAARFGCTAEINSTQPSKGWSKVVPTPDFVKWCTATLNVGVFDVERDQTITADAVPNSRMKKWTCGCTVVRSAVALAAVCARCHRAFWWAAPGESMPEQHRASIAATVIDTVSYKSTEYSVRIKRT